MRKVYYSNTQSAEKRFWETYWTRESLEDALAYCEIDYLRPIFLEYFPPTGAILEGGCGLGQYVVYYENLGYDIYGLDWVSKPLRRIKQHQGRVKVLTGDVLRLPFKSKSFKAYYSGGVVEHFEGGPSPALREAHRVLDDGGLLLITVPYLNAKRRLEDFLSAVVTGRRLRPAKSVNGVELVYQVQDGPRSDTTHVDGYHFHEYMFTRREFTRVLEQVGFRVVRAHGVSIQWGFMELPWVRGLYKRLRSDRPNREAPLKVGRERLRLEGPSVRFRGGARSLLKDLLISESSDRLMAKPLLWALRPLVGHLILFVCQKAS